MDIIEELKLIKEKDYETAYDKTMEQIDNWQKKLHLIKVIKLVSEVEKAINNGSLKALGVVSMVFATEIEKKIYFSLKAYDDDDYTVERFMKSGITKPEFQDISFALTELHDSQKNHLGKFDSVTVTLENTTNIRETLLSMFLSSELRKILDYSEMQVEISNNEPTNIHKKIKV